ncbi:MAG TPA: rhodanese-like domain-containing protein [Candidatus Dormibacteraeota bacterium]|nr:rhodanese-like domain-containing protein [Candidatus Dormibacteraeota bacterium]
MPSQVFRVSEVGQLLDQGAQLVDVLDPDDFEHSHLPGAINIPLKTLTRETTSRLDRSRPVVVYCNDFG